MGLPLPVLATLWHCLVLSQTYEAVDNSATCAVVKKPRPGPQATAGFPPSRQLPTDSPATREHVACQRSKRSTATFEGEKGEEKYATPPPSSASRDPFANGVRSTSPLPFVCLVCYSFDRQGASNRNGRGQSVLALPSKNPTTKRGLLSFAPALPRLDSLVRGCEGARVLVSVMACTATSEARGPPWESKSKAATPPRFQLRRRAGLLPTRCPECMSEELDVHTT